MKAIDKKYVKKERELKLKLFYAIVFFALLLIVALMVIFKIYDFGDMMVNLIGCGVSILISYLFFDNILNSIVRENETQELSLSISEVLLGNPEVLAAFEEKQKLKFAHSTIEAIASEDKDLAEVLFTPIKDFAENKQPMQIRPKFSYHFELLKDLPVVYDDIFTQKEDYLYVQENLDYTVKSVGEYSSLSDTVTLGFFFDNASLDEEFNMKKDEKRMPDCIFREKIDLLGEDVKRFQEIVSSVDAVNKYLKLVVKIDGLLAKLVEVYAAGSYIYCQFQLDQPIDLHNMQLKLMFHMPKRYDSMLEAMLVDPTYSPTINLSYQDEIVVDAVQFLGYPGKNDQKQNHETVNGVYDFAILDEWILPVSGVVFYIKKSNN